MSRFVLKFRELCILTGLLGLGGVILLVSLFETSSWDAVFEDIDVTKYTEIPVVQFVAEYPVTQHTIDEINSFKEPSRSFSIEIGKSGINGRTTNPFKNQVTEGFSKLKVSLPYDLSGQKYAFYVDVPKSNLKRFKNTYLYYYLVMDDYELFIDGKLKRRVNSRRGDLGTVQLLGDTTQDYIRVLWVCKNSKKNKVMGLFYKYGLSLRGEKDVVSTAESAWFKAYIPHVITSVSFLLISIIAFGFAFSAKGYLDIWAFAAFSMSMGLYVWSQTPIFYWSWGWEDNGNLLRTVRACLSATFIIFASVLTMSFFRLEGRHIRIKDLTSYFKNQTPWQWIKESTNILEHPFRMTLLSTIVVSGCILYAFWPLTYKGPGYGDIMINTRLAYVLFFSQCLAFFFGYRSLLAIRKKFIDKDLAAQVKLINKRIATSFVFTLGMGIMVIAFLKGLKGVTNALETDLVLLAAIFPASAMLLMFFWMVSSANRFYQKFAPRLGQIDHEVLAFGEKALDQRYFGCLLVFDLKGMKKLNIVRSENRECEEAVDKLLYDVEHNLSDLIQRGRITFKYKSNGDEFIFNMRAKDQAEARELMVELTALWHKVSEAYLQKWRTDLAENLKGHITSEVIEEVCSSLEIHVLITTLLDMKITVKGGIHKPTANPDFIDARFTHLTTLFKPTRHNKIAMYRDDAELYLERTGAEARFVHDHDELGFLELGLSLGVDRVG